MLMVLSKSMRVYVLACRLKLDSFNHDRGGGGIGSGESFYITNSKSKHDHDDSNHHHDAKTPTTTNSDTSKERQSIRMQAHLLYGMGEMGVNSLLLLLELNGLRVVVVNQIHAQ